MDSKVSIVATLAERAKRVLRTITLNIQICLGQDALVSTVVYPVSTLYLNGVCEVIVHAQQLGMGSWVSIAALHAEMAKHALTTIILTGRSITHSMFWNR